MTELTAPRAHRLLRLLTMLGMALLMLCAAQSLWARGAGEAPPEPPAPQSDRQSEIPAVGTFPVPLLFVFTHSGSERSEAELEALRNSAAAATAVRAPSARLRIVDSAGHASGERELRERALQSEAVGWVEIGVDESETGSEIRAAGYAVTAIQPVFEVQYREPGDLAGPRLSRAWQPAVEAFEAAYETLVELALAELRYTSLTLRAVAGTSVDGLGETARTVPDDGVLRAMLPSPSAYSITARRSGHYPDERLVLLLEDPVDIELEQPRRSLYSWDLGLANASYPSLEVARRVRGDYLFVRGGLTTYVLGLVPFGGDDDGGLDGDEDRLLAGEDLTVFSLQLGSYLHAPYGRARAYAAAGTLWRVIHTSGYRGRDPVAPWALVTTLGVENRPSRPWRLFFEWQPVFYRTEYPEVLQRRLPGTVQLTGDRHDSGDEFFFTGAGNSAWVFSAGAFRLGVRWQP